MEETKKGQYQLSNTACQFSNPSPYPRFTHTQTNKQINVSLSARGPKATISIRCKCWWHNQRQELIFRSPLKRSTDGLIHCTLHRGFVAISRNGGEREMQGMKKIELQKLEYFWSCVNLHDFSIS